MVDNPRRPLLNPVLRFTKEPKPEGVSGGGARTMLNAVG